MVVQVYVCTGVSRRGVHSDVTVAVASTAVGTACQLHVARCCCYWVPGVAHVPEARRSTFTQFAVASWLGTVG